MESSYFYEQNEIKWVPVPEFFHWKYSTQWECIIHITGDYHLSFIPSHIFQLSNLNSICWWKHFTIFRALHANFLPMAVFSGTSLKSDGHGFPAAETKEKQT